MIIEGWANIYREAAGKYRFEHTIFIYPTQFAAKMSSEPLDGGYRIALAIPLKIEIPERRSHENPTSEG